MHSGSDVTKTLLEFSSVWHGVCINWNENIHSVEPCVTHVPPPLPTVIPLPHRHRGYPLEYGGTVAHGNFYPKNGKTQGALFKNGKNSGGGTLSEGGLPGNFWERENSGRGYPFWKGFMGKILRNGKSHVGALKKWENSGRGYPFGRGFTGKIWKKGNFMLYL